MRILRMIDSLGWTSPQIGWGGAEMAQVVFATGLQQRNMRLTIISLKESAPPLAEKLRAVGVHIERFAGRNLVDPWRIVRIVRFLKRERFDILQTHLTYANIIGALVGRLTGIPVVATLHNERPDERERLHHTLRDQLETCALRYGATRVIAVGHFAARAYQQSLGKMHIDVLPNAVASVAPITPAERLALRSELVGEPSRPILLAIGRLAPQKAFDDLLRAFANLHQTHPQAALLIAGNGPQRDTLQEQIEALGLVGHAWLLGHRSDIYRVMRSSDLFVSSSHWEGLQRSLLEAMAAGLPAVTTAVGDAPLVVVDGTGTVVPPRNRVALADALRSFLDNPQRMYAAGVAAEAHINNNYSMSAWVDQHLNLFNQVCSSPVASCSSD